MKQILLENICQEVQDCYFSEKRTHKKSPATNMASWFSGIHPAKLKSRVKEVTTAEISEAR